MSLLIATNTSVAQYSPAAERSVIEPSEKVFQEEQSRELTYERNVLRSKEKESSPDQFIRKKLFKPKKKKRRNMGWDGELFWGIFGATIMLAGVIAGMILFLTIGWWSVLVGLGGILLGLLFCAIPGMVGSRKLDGFLSGIIGAVGLVVSGGLWVLWILIMGIIELTKL